MVLAMAWSTTILAQEGRFSPSITLGISTPILDNGIGIHLGVNPTFSINQHLYLEGQVSYGFTYVSGYFLSGEEGRQHALSTLVGARIYLNKADNTNRYFLNLLLGGTYGRAILDSDRREIEIYPGITTGAYLERNRIILGLGVESPEHILLKAGYTF